MKNAFPKLYTRAQTEPENKRKTRDVKCNHPGCTGSHSNNDWHNMCPTARERKRFRQAQWIRNKYWTDFGWAGNKRSANWYYKSTAAGILSVARSSSAARVERLRVMLNHIELQDNDAKAEAPIGGER